MAPALFAGLLALFWLSD